MWSRAPLIVPSFSEILKFRISGKGKTFYGDGIALWFVQQPYYIEGEVHGFQEHFTGNICMTSPPFLPSLSLYQVIITAAATVVTVTVAEIFLI